MSRRTLAILLALLGAASVALAVVAIMLGTKVAAAQQADTRRDAAVTAAKQAGVNLATMDYRRAGADVQRLMTGLTGGAKDEMAKSGRQQVVAQLGKVKTWSVGQVLSAAVVSSDSDSAQVLVVVDQTVRSADVPNGVVHHLRWQMTVNRVGGRWLVSKLEPTE
jgi:Mce-associated membrane protein